jgi:hypothetical protein
MERLGTFYRRFGMCIRKKGDVKTRDGCRVDDAPWASLSDSGSGLDDLDNIEGTDVLWDEFSRARPLDIERFLSHREIG